MVGVVIKGNPLLLPRRVVFYGGVIVECSGAATRSSDINVPGVINGNAYRFIVAIAGSIVAGNPRFIYATGRKMRCALGGEWLRTRCGEQRDKDSGEEDEHSKRNAEVQESRLSSVFLFHR